MSRSMFYLAVLLIGGGLIVYGVRDSDGGDIAWGIVAVLVGALLLKFDRD